MTTFPQRIEVVEGTRVEITWDDGTESTYTARDLRTACMCAVCREPTGAAALEAVLAGDEPVTISDTSLVGGYALRFVFGPDDHGTGVYPLEDLRAMSESGAST
jgi:ATP-binding protein involved in chromosome partitioning